MKLAYFELVGGASGNMILGALIDAGADVHAIERALRTIPVDGWTLERKRVVKRGIAATHVDFTIEARGSDDGHGRHLADVLTILERSGLSPDQKRRARAIYTRLGEAEARVHGQSSDHIHFHEVGAVDAILDVAAACIGLDLLEIERVAASPFPIGRGSIAMAHGRYPNPPPATADLLRGTPTFDAGIDGELVTTTGAAILTHLVTDPGVRPPMRTATIGYGAGTADFPIPNVLRVSIGEASDAREPSGSDEVVVLEATIDDMSPQHFELAVERVLEAGAFDIWLAPVTMKKLRPAVLFGVVAPPQCEEAIAAVMLRETSTLGVRVRRERRHTLERAIEEVATQLGSVRVKSARVPGGEDAVRRTLEYDDVVRIARERGRPIAEVAARLAGMVDVR